jgi:hypothetical protein
MEEDWIVHHGTGAIMKVLAIDFIALDRATNGSSPKVYRCQSAPGEIVNLSEQEFSLHEHGNI